MEYEFETLIHQLATIEAVPEFGSQVSTLTGNIRFEIGRARDLVETQTRREIQRDAATVKTPIYAVEIWRISKQLRSIKQEIANYKDKLLREVISHHYSGKLSKEGISHHYSGKLSKEGISHYFKDQFSAEDILYFEGKLSEQDISHYSDVLLTDKIAHFGDRFFQVATPSLVHAAEQHPQQQQTVPPHLGRCLYYLILFPDDSPVPARRLTALWVAEGLIHSNDKESNEQIAERYLHELIDLGVLIGEGKKRSGKVKACKMDAGRRRRLLEETNKANFLKDSNLKIRRLVDHNGFDGGSNFIRVHGNPEIFQSVPKYREVITFLSFSTQEGSKPGEDIGDFLRKCISARCFIWLRVLDLERVFRPQLPNTLGKLIALKYLGLRLTYLERLPDSVDKLLSLQVLDVKHTYISVLPRSIWRMEYLRHLYLSEAYRTRFPQPPIKVTLTALQTLWGAFVDEDAPIEGGLDRLLNIRKLGLACITREYKGDQMKNKLEAINRWISNLEFLESLRLKSRDESGDAADLHLTSLAENHKLSTVYLLGKLDGVVLCTLPVSLTNITLSGSGLDLDPLQFLERLPYLVVLQLLGNSVVCRKMCFIGRGFRRLKVLWIWKLEKLEELEAEEGSLPCLEELEIRSCDNLHNLPDRLQRHENLEIKLTGMKQDFLNRERIKYAQNQLVSSDDQLILKNRQMPFAQEAKASALDFE